MHVFTNEINSKTMRHLLYIRSLISYVCGILVLGIQTQLLVGSGNISFKMKTNKFQCVHQLERDMYEAVWPSWLARKF